MKNHRQSLRLLTVGLLLALSTFISFTRAEVLAFPGAQGFGKYTTGGRGGKVIYVTSLADTNTPGTLRWAINQTGSRIIMFKVSGTITLTSQMDIIYGDVTIAGQTAPGDGICMKGYPVAVSADNVIIRYMRFRMGDENKQEADAFGGRCHSNIMIDHCSVSWSVDECCSFYENTNFTLQWTMLSESLRLSFHAKGPHGYGAIWGGHNASFHHNLIAHHDSRAPRFGTNPCTVGTDTIDYRNNVIYNWAGLGCYGGGGDKINMVNNYYKPGPATPNGGVRGRICAIDRDMTSSAVTDGNHAIYMVWGKYYVAGNYFDPSTSTSSNGLSYVTQTNSDNWTYGIYSQISSSMYTNAAAEKVAMRLSSPLPSAGIQTTTPQIAYNKVLGYVGCSKSRDTLDARVILETKNGTATYKGLSKYNGLASVTYPAGTVIGIDTLTVATTINWGSIGYPKWGLIDNQTDIKPTNATTSWSPWPTLVSTSAPTDTDGDGMPDDWETANGLNPSINDANLTTLNGEYTNLDMYLNSLVNNITINQYDGVTLSTLSSTTGVTVPTSGTYVPGETVTTTAIPNLGYKFVHWEDASGNIVSTTNPYTFAISATTTLKAVYTSASNYIVNFTVDPANTGTISYATSGSYIGGTRLNAKANYNKGYEFVKWTDNTGAIISTSDSLINYIVSKDETIRAVFQPHVFRIPTTTATIENKMDIARTGDTLMLAGGTYANPISFRNGKILTLMSAGTGSVLFTNGITSGSVSDNGCGLIFDGVTIQPSGCYFMDGATFGNISIVAFHNDTIQNIGRCLIRGGNTTPSNLGTIEISNCIIKNCGSGGYCFLYPKFIVSNVIVKNSTLIRYYGGESFFRPQATSSTNVLNFDFENNTVFKWSKASSYAICTSGTTNSTASTFIFKNNIFAEPGVAGQTPKVLNVTGGNLLAQNNLAINYGGYAQTSAISSVINDLSTFSVADIYNVSIGFQDTTSVKNDFHILSTSILASASTSGGIIGDPRWLKVFTANPSVSANQIKVFYANDALQITNLPEKSTVQVFSCDGKILYSKFGTSQEISIPMSVSFAIVKIFSTNQTAVFKAIK